MTWNIEGGRRFGSARNENLKRAFTRSLTTSSPDVICLQEDMPDSEACNALKRELLEPSHQQLRIDGCDSQGAVNGILVKYERLPYVKALPGLVFKKMRTAAAVDIGNGIVVVNTHLPGGRFEDRDFRNRVTYKRDMLRDILEAYDFPAVICGDFNGAPDDGDALAGYNVYRELATAVDREVFTEYYAGVHTFLRSVGYESIAPRPASTSRFGTCPDWIYGRGVAPREVGLVPAFDGDAYLSDHHAVIARFGLDKAKWPKPTTSIDSAQPC